MAGAFTRPTCRKENQKKTRVQGHPSMSSATEGGEQWPMRRVLLTKPTVHAPMTLWPCNYLWNGVQLFCWIMAREGQSQMSPTSATDCDSDPSGLTMDLQSLENGQHTLKIVQWNVEGVWLKKTELQQFLKLKAIDVCCIQETHLSSLLQGVLIKTRKPTKGRTADPGEKQHPCHKNPDIRSS